MDSEFIGATELNYVKSINQEISKHSHVEFGSITSSGNISASGDVIVKSNWYRTYFSITTTPR